MNRQSDQADIIRYANKMFDFKRVGDREFQKDQSTKKYSFSLTDSDVEELNSNYERTLFVHRLKSELDPQEKFMRITDEGFSSDSENDPTYIPSDDDDGKAFEYYDSDEDYDTEGDYDTDEDMTSSISEASAIDYDNDMEPPPKIKSQFFIYLLKSSPLVLVIVFLLLISNITSFADSTPMESSGYIHHQLYLIQNEINQLKASNKELQDKFGIKLHSLESQMLNNATTTIIANKTIISPRIELIQTELQSLQQEMIGLKQTLNDELKKQKPTINEDEKMKIIDETKKQLLSYAEKPRVQSKVVRYQGKYTGSNPQNVATSGRITRSMTSIPKTTIPAKTFMGKIMYGYSKFIRSTIQHTWWKRNLIGFDDINILDSSNNPENALSADPRIYWQALTNDIPLTYTVQLESPIYLTEFGIFQPRTDYIVSSTPKFMEVLVKPTKNIEKLRDTASKYYNQDFISGKLRKEFVKVGELKYKLQGPNYQSMTIQRKINQSILDTSISKLMLIIDSNWGHENLTTLNTVRIFGTYDKIDKPVNMKSAAIPNLGDDMAV